MGSFVFCSSIVLSALFIVTCVDCRATVEQKSESIDEEHAIQEVELHVITKREALRDIHQEYPKIRGHTFKASEPLDPTKKNTDDIGPQNVFAGFETESHIFNPVVEEGGVHDTETGEERHYPEAHTNAETEFEGRDYGTLSNTDDEDPDDVKGGFQKESREDDIQNDGDRIQNDIDTSQYSRQRPYPFTSSTDDDYGRTRIYQTHTTSSDDSGVERQVNQTRTVLSGGGASSEYAEPTRYQAQRRAEVYGSSGQSYEPTAYQTERRVTTYTSGSSNQYQPTDRRTYTSSQQQYGSGYPNSNTQYDSRTYYRSGTSYPSSGEVRGAPYNGPRYVDSNGHYIDAEGRHLDSTGRFYDVSGRYTDATVSQRVTYYPGTSGSTQYQHSGSRVPSQYVGQDQSRPVNSYGGTQFYSGGTSYQTTYNPITSQISSDPNCPITNTRVTINGMTCTDAVSQIGNYVCYNYERVSEECCQRCLQVKRTNQVGCEYGDRSSQCRSIQPHDCYHERNRQICCERCEQIRQQMSSQVSGLSNCEYGDLTPRCDNVRLRPYLCYHNENARTCCSSCPRMANQREPDCRWGDMNPMMCEPFDSNRRLQLNCYIPELKRQCCSTCEGLKSRMRENIPGCEYGDWPMLYSNGFQQFTCAEFVRNYHTDNHCSDPDFAQKCCYTCHRYRQVRG